MKKIKILDSLKTIPLKRKRYSLKHSIFVSDRGMVSVENLRFLEEEGIGYIVALRHRQARELIFEKKI